MEIGTLVEVKRTTSDPSMTENRLGIIIRREITQARKNDMPVRVYHVQFSNGHILKFHEDFLEVVDKC